MNHNRERCIWQLWEVTSCPLARTLYQICRWWLEASPSLLPCLSNFASTFLKKHPLPLPANPFRIIEIHQWLPVLECRQKICDRRLPAQGSISSWFQSVLPRDDGPMLLLKKALHPYLLPLVECTLIGLPHPFGKLLQRELCLLQANWGFAFSTALVRQIVALISCITFVVGHLRQQGRIHNPCDIWFPRFRWRLEWFCEEAYWVSPRSAGSRLRWRSRAGSCWLIEWMNSQRSGRHSRCTWR